MEELTTSLGNVEKTNENDKQEYNEEVLTSYSVSVLKEIAEKKGLIKYKSLRKPQLVDLILKSHEE